MRNLRTFGAAALVALALILGTLTSAPTASAAPANPVHARVRDGWGAISLSIDGAGGHSKNYSTKAKAIKSANSACKRVSRYPGRCVWFIAVRNQCGALWYKYDARGFVNTKQGMRPHIGHARALSKAVKRARHGNSGGKVIKTCT